MEFGTWLSLATICTLGALSPGPSIAVILQITAKSGRNQGLIAAVAHGLGIGCYAFLAAAGLAVVIASIPGLFEGLQLIGAIFLVYLGLKALGVSIPFFKAKTDSEPAEEITAKSSRSSAGNFTIGFLTAFLNPKVALFFIALFSQFVSDDSGLKEKMIIASTPAAIDAIWYSLVAVVASSQSFGDRFSRFGTLFQKAFGVILIALAIRVAFG